MDIVITAYNFILNCVQIYLLYLVVRSTTPIKRNSTGKILHYLTLNAVIIQVVRDLASSQVIGTVICVSAIVLLLMLFYGWKRTNVSALAVFMILSILSEFLVTLVLLIFSSDVRALILGDSIYTAIAALLAKMIQAYLTFLYLRILKKDKRYTTAGSSGFIFFGLIIIFIMLMCIILVFMWSVAGEPIPDWFLFFYLICTVLFIAVALITQRIAVINTQEREERKLIELQGELSKEVHHSLEQLKQYEHDYRKHLQTILALTHEGMYKEAEKYYIELTMEFDEAHLILIENMPALSATLQRFKTLSQKRGILFSAELPAALETNVSEMHLCVIMSNLLDNAVEACEKLEENKRILVSIRCDTPLNTLHIHVENTYASVKSALRFVDGLPSTTKEDRDLHGFGLRSIKRIVRIYHGSFHLSSNETEHTFIVDINA